MKIDLDELERKARAATPCMWGTHRVVGMPRNDEPIMATVIADDLDERDRVQQVADCYDNTHCSDKQCEANAEHIAANSPPVTLALIARIRELEASLDRALVAWNTADPLDNWRAEMDAERAVLEKGVSP